MRILRLNLVFALLGALACVQLWAPVSASAGSRLELAGSGYVSSSQRALETSLDSAVQGLASPRAIWLQGNGVSTPDRVRATLDRLAKAGFDTVLYYAGSGTAGWRSDLLVRWGSVTADYDPLAYVVEQAHARGIKVQAWWCPGVAPHSGSFRSRHHNWDIAVLKGIPDHFHWLNFSIPAARKFVGDVVVEIAQNYDVDGIHLDYIRYPAPPPYSPIDPRDFFNPTDVPTTVHDAYMRLKAVRPNVELTAAVIDGQGGSRNHMQNWARWLSGDYIDRVYPMAYYAPRENSRLQRRINEWKQLSHPERIAPGLSVVDSNELGKIPAKTSAQMIAQLDMCKQGGFPAFSIFDSRTITTEILNRLASYSR